MKILLVNLDVGSGIEYVGNKILSWLNELKNGNEIDINNYKNQTCVSMFTQELISYKPDIVVVNECYPRIIEPLYYYKIYNPNVRILFVCHSWKTLIKKMYSEENHLFRQMVHLFSRESCEKIICLSKKDVEEKYMNGISDKIKELYMPVSSKEYRIITPWNKRTKLFGNFGGGNYLRLSEEFLHKFGETNLSLDVYGFKNPNVPNIHEYDRIAQCDMPIKLNEYKFFILPHSGQEVFFITLLQSIMCGTIPLVVNNRNSKEINPSWIDWADGLYFGTDSVDSFIDNLKKLSIDKRDFTCISEDISKRASIAFNEDKIKKEIFDFVNAS